MPVYEPGSTFKPQRRQDKKFDGNRQAKSFGQVTHETLHAALGYISDVCRFNALSKKSVSKGDEAEGCGEFGEVWRRLGKRRLQGNVEDACDLLFDTCKLYCVANDVPEDDLVRYVKSLGKEGVASFSDEESET